MLWFFACLDSPLYRTKKASTAYGMFLKPYLDPKSMQKKNLFAGAGPLFLLLSGGLGKAQNLKHPKHPIDPFKEPCKDL